jgi:hypothetical protein
MGCGQEVRNLMPMEPGTEVLLEPCTCSYAGPRAGLGRRFIREKVSWKEERLGVHECSSVILKAGNCLPLVNLAYVRMTGLARNLPITGQLERRKEAKSNVHKRIG